jgi:hypothetical protein
MLDLVPISFVPRDIFGLIEKSSISPKTQLRDVRDSLCHTVCPYIRCDHMQTYLYTDTDIRWSFHTHMHLYLPVMLWWTSTISSRIAVDSIGYK